MVLDVMLVAPVAVLAMPVLAVAPVVVPDTPAWMLLAVDVLPMVLPEMVYMPAAPEVLIPTTVAPVAAAAPCAVMLPMVLPAGELPMFTVPVLADNIPYTVGAAEETTVIEPVPVLLPIMLPVVVPMLTGMTADAIFIPANGVPLEVVRLILPMVFPWMLVAWLVPVAVITIPLITLANGPPVLLIVQVPLKPLPLPPM